MISRQLRGNVLLSLLFSGLALAQTYTMTTFAGSDRFGEGKQATSVPLRYPFGTAQDTDGTLYVADRDDHRIRRISPTGVLTTVAGNGRPGFSGDGGPATSAQLRKPTNIRLDGKGNLYISDYDNQRIRKVNLSTGIITTVVGSGTAAHSGDGGPAVHAGIDPYDFAIDVDGNLYISDTLNHRIRKVNASDGIITSITGTGRPGFLGDNGAAEGSTIYFPLGVTVDAQKNVYFVDYGNNRIRKITAATGRITTVAGNGLYGYTGDNGLATSARLLEPLSVAVEANGDLLIAALGDVRRVTAATGIIRRLTGSISYGFGGDGGAPIGGVWGIFNAVSVAPNGDILLTDPYNFRVRRIRANVLGTVAGAGIPSSAPATATYLNTPANMVVNPKGGLWFSDSLFNMVRSIDGGTVTKVAGDGYPTAEVERLDTPQGLALDSQGALFIADTGNNRIIKYSPNGQSAVFAGGRGYGYEAEFGQAISAKMASPRAVAVASDGTVYIADTDNCRIRQVSLGTIRAFAGSGECAYIGDGGPAKDAGLQPWDIVLDGKGGLLVADARNHRVRRVDIASGIITTVAGIGTPDSTGDGGPAVQAQLFLPQGVAVDSAGRIYIAEYGSMRVRMIEVNGTIRTIAGTGQYEFNGESGPALAMNIDPMRVAVGPDGSVYVSDGYNDRIRKLTLAFLTSLQVVQGAGSTGEIGSKVTLQVKALEGAGIAMAQVPVRFEVTSGSAQLSSVSVTTGNSGIAQVQVTLGSTLGPVVVRASADGVPPVLINLTATAPVPTIDSAAVVGAGLSAPSVRAISHGGILTAFGRNFGVGSTFRKVGGEDLVNGKVPTNFAGICVDVSGVRAPVFGASDTQVNFQAPAGLSGTGTVTILTGCGTANEKATNAIVVPVQSAAPEFFYFQYSQDGKNAVAATNTVTGAYLASAAMFPGSGIQPAKPGDLVTMYATGFGDTNPSVVPGEFFGAAAQVKGQVRVLFNGQELPRENVLYVGITPFSPGLYQLNLRVPSTTLAGDWPLVIEIDGVQSPAGAYLTVKP